MLETQKHYENPLGLTPVGALIHYINQIRELDALREAASGDFAHGDYRYGTTLEDILRNRIKDHMDRSEGVILKTMVEVFPPDQFPGIVDDQPPGVVEKLDAIVGRICAAYDAGTLSEQDIKVAYAEMGKICRE